MNSSNLIVTDWFKEFDSRIQITTKSRKQPFTHLDALQKSKGLRTSFDDCMIEYSSFIRSEPLLNNDYYKYVNSYAKGKELDLKYFKHNVTKLKEYYKKFEANKNYNPFKKSQYEDYVLFMMLKLNGFYKKEYDSLFNVKIQGDREYNPLTNIPSVIRSALPFEVKEYDIKRAFSSFIDLELGIDRKEDVYSLIDKKLFNTLLNLHAPESNIDKVRAQLSGVYGAETNKVITERRFNCRGAMFNDLVKYEAKAILDFVTVNNLTNYVRLHDGVFVKADIKCDVVEFGKIKFSIKETIKPMIENFRCNFYTADETGENIKTSPKQYADFFEQENFIRISEQGNDTITIFKDSNNVINPFNHKTDVVPFLKENINDFDTYAIENKIAFDCYNDVQKGYLLLNPIPLTYHRDTRNTFGIPFKNGFVEFTKGKENVEVMEYKKVHGFFAPHNTQEREFTFTAVPEASVFQRFLIMVSTGKDLDFLDLTDDDKKTFYSFCSCFGYLIHQYKDPSNSPSIVLSDAGANDRTRNGNRGKTMFTKAVSEVRKAMVKGGNEFDPNYLFNYADLTKDYDVFVIDDVHAGFNYNALYTQISGAINCQRKGKPAQEIPFSESPKFIITTNWSYRVEDNSSSTQRRFVEYQFTDFFNLENTPVKVLKHRLFEDWNANEWNRFYNFAFYCVGYYLEFGLERIQYNKIEDNFKASFSNDVVLEEMERIISELTENRLEFSVSDFINVYKKFDNNLRFENYFNHKNTKSLIDLFIKHHNKPIEYLKMSRKWKILKN